MLRTRGETIMADNLWEAQIKAADKLKADAKKRANKKK